MTDIQIIYDGPIVNKADAKSEGLTLYFTGKSCKHGHVDQRWTCSSRCKMCQRISTDRHIEENKEKYKAISSIRSKELWSKNKEELSKAHREWRLKNLEKRAEYLREWRSVNGEEYNRYQREWRKRNPELSRKHNRTNRKNNPNTIRACHSARRSREMGADGRYYSHDVKKIMRLQGNKCAEPTCGVDLSDGYHVDHIMPLSKGGSNWPSNLQCLCPTCNIVKGAKLPHEWAREKGRLL